MLRKLFLLIIITVFGIASCSQIAPTSVYTSGIEGYVTEGPMCPGPVRVGAPECPDKPYPTTITVLDMNGKRVTQFDTDANGYFKVSLAPGTYVLQPKPGAPLPMAADQTVVVAADEYTQVSILYDTGMR